MSVKAKMTAIADNIRSILGISGKMGLDAMSANLGVCHDTVNEQGDLLDQAILAIDNKVAGNTGSGSVSLPSGVTALASGVYVPDSNKSSRVDINHGLSVTPNFCVWILETDTSNTTLSSINVGGSVFYKQTKYSSTSPTKYNVHISITGYNSSGYIYSSSTRADSETYFTNSSFGIYANSTYPLKSGNTYRWVCGLVDV